MVAWGAFKTTLRRSILQDEAAVLWDDDMLADYAGWTLDGLCNHTALLSSITYTGDGSTYQHALPSDLYLPPDRFGLVYRLDGLIAENQPTHLYPAYQGFDISPYDDRAYTVWSANTLETGTPTPEGVALVVRYYALWPHPVNDSDELAIPQYLQAALAYGMAIHALTWRELQEADVGSGRTKPDIGQPEQNAYRQTSKWWMQRYERELQIVPMQERMRAPSPSR